MLFPQPLSATNIRMLAATPTVRQDAGGFCPVLSSPMGACLETSSQLAAFFFFFKRFYLFIHDSHREREREREREAETQAEAEAGSMHREPDVGFDPGSPGSRPGPKAGAKPLRHPGIPTSCILMAV